MGELGLTFIKVAKFEMDVAAFNPQRVRAADTRRVATAAVKASRFYRESNAQAVKHLVWEPFLLETEPLLMLFPIGFNRPFPCKSIIIFWLILLSLHNVLCCQDKLHEYLGLMQAVHNAFSDRSNALLTVQTLSAELSSMSSRAEKLEAASSKIFGGDRTRNRKLEELRDAIKVTEDAKSCAVKEYERIKVKYH